MLHADNKKAKGGRVALEDKAEAISKRYNKTPGGAAAAKRITDAIKQAKPRKFLFGGSFGPTPNNLQIAHDNTGF
jgi:hypothetical protein